MHSYSDDEWLLAISILTVFALLCVTIWMVVMVAQDNRNRSRRKDIAAQVEEIMKPSKNGRSKKSDG